MAIILVLIAAVLVLLYQYLNEKHSSWKTTGIQFMTPPTFLGAIQGSFLRNHNEMCSFAPEEPYVAMTTLGLPVFSIRDPDIIKQILVKDFGSFHDRFLREVNEKTDPLALSIFVIEGKRHRPFRAKISPAFTSGKLRDVFKLSKRYVEKMSTQISFYADTSKAVNLAEYVNRCIVDIIVTNLFGYNEDSMKEVQDNFVKMLKAQFRTTPCMRIRQSVLDSFPSLKKIIPPDQERRDITEFFLNPFLETFADRRKNSVRGNNFIDFLLQVQKTGKFASEAEDERLELTDLLMAAQAWGFFAAGSATSSNTTTAVFLEIANNKHIQDWLRVEVLQVISRHGAITYDALKEMTYLDQILSETLRLYPPVPVLRRQVSQKYTMPDRGAVLPVGTQILVHIRKLHRDPKHYPDPDKFDPERFSEEAVQHRNKFVYLPFGAGPRQCIGRRLALMRIKEIIATVVSKFELRPKEGVPYPPVFATDSVLTTLKHGAPVYLTRIPSKQ